VAVLSLLAALAAVLFFALATVQVSLGGVPEQAAGLLCLAIALAAYLVPVVLVSRGEA
jgi:hypothetical protein